MVLCFECVRVVTKCVISIILQLLMNKIEIFRATIYVVFFIDGIVS